VPTLAHGHLNQVANKLQDILLVQKQEQKQEIILCESTKEALLLEEKRSHSDFSKSLVPFPNLYDLVKTQITVEPEYRFIF
jgi:hypothetical protein